MSFKPTAPAVTRLWIPAAFSGGFGGMPCPTGVDTSWLQMVDLPIYWKTFDLAVWTSGFDTSADVQWRLRTLTVEPGFGVALDDYGTLAFPPSGFGSYDALPLWTPVTNRANKVYKKTVLNITREGSIDTNPGPAFVHGIDLLRRT